MISLLATALAAAPVLHTGDPAGALRGVATDLGDRASGIAAPLPTTLGGGGTLALLGAPARPCTGDVYDGQAMLPEVRRLTSFALELEWEAVVAYADQLSERFACLNNPLNPDAAPELYFIAGVAAGELGDAERARRYFRRALDFNPNLRWHPDYGTAAKFAFADVLAAASRPEAVLVLGPGAEGVSVVRIDGIPRPTEAGHVRVPVGEHVVQIEGETTRSWLVELPAGALAIAVPNAVTQAAPALVTDPARRVVLDAALRDASPATPAYVWTGTRTRERSPEGLWTELPPLAATEARRRRGGDLLLAGAPLAVLGGTFGALCQVAGSRYSGSAEDSRTPSEDRQKLIDYYTFGSVAGFALAGAGLGLSGVGVALLVSTPGVEVRGSW